MAYQRTGIASVAGWEAGGSIKSPGSRAGLCEEIKIIEGEDCGRPSMP